jgi:hypothetical protein
MTPGQVQQADRPARNPSRIVRRPPNRNTVIDLKGTAEASPCASGWQARDLSNAQMGRASHCGLWLLALSWSTMAEVPSNCDLLDWFSEDERKVCGSCGERACVSLPRVSAHFCLACGAATIAGTRLDVHGIRV